MTETIPTPILLLLSTEHQEMMDNIHWHDHPPRTKPSDSDSPVRLAASIDRLVDQQRQYFAMMTQANAHVLAQLQKIVLIMQPFIATLFLKEDASTPPQKPESLPNTISVTTTPDPKSYQHAHDNLCNYPVTSETIPTIAMTLVKLPLSSGVTSTPVPPWPPQCME